MNERLKLVSGEDALVLDPADGRETLGQATDVFRYIDHNFERWNCNIVGPPTKQTAVQVYEMIRNSTFQELFGGFGAALDSLALTQEQIKQFAKHHPDWLQEGGNGTFFLFKVGNEFFVAAAYFFSDGQIGVRLRRLTWAQLRRLRRVDLHTRAHDEIAETWLGGIRGNGSAVCRGTGHRRDHRQRLWAATRGEARQTELPDLLRSQGAGGVRARRGDDPLLLVPHCAQSV